MVDYGVKQALNADLRKGKVSPFLKRANRILGKSRAAEAKDWNG